MLVRIKMTNGKWRRFDGVTSVSYNATLFSVNSYSKVVRIPMRYIVEIEEMRHAGN